MTQEQQAVRFAELEHRAKSNTYRIDKLEDDTDALKRLVTSVELIASEQQHQTEAMKEIQSDVSALGKKVETLERKPGEQWESVVQNIIRLVVAAVVGFILAKVGLH